MHYVYVLKSELYLKYYIGCTGDLDKRLIRHNEGLSKYTKKYKPWNVIYSEAYIDKFAAFRREKYLKSHAGRNFLKKVWGGSSIG